MTPDLPPGSPSPAFVQMLRWMRHPLPTLEAATRRYGDVFTMRMPVAPPFVVFSDPAAVKEIFTADPEDLRAGEAAVVLKAILGEHSLLLLDGERHLRERRLMMPPFHGERMRRYGEVMRDTTLRTLARWPLGRPFPIHAEMQAITLEVILRTVFGLDDEARLERMRAPLVRWTTLGTSPLGTLLLMSVPAVHAHRLRDLALSRLQLGPLSLDVGRLAPWAPIVRSKSDVDQLLYQEIQTRRRGPATDRDDVLSMLLEARDEHGAPMSDEELHDQMLTLVVAGHETSATTLAWTIHHLLAHPEWMARVQAELAGAALPDDLPRLEILDAVIKETLRLTPIVPFVARKLARPATIGGRDLPAGVVAMACIYLTHRRPELWPDPERFDPGRFVGKKVDPYSYYPFGGGTRRCLGMAFASYEMKIVLATLLQRIALAPVPGHESHLVRRGITFAPSDGMPVVASDRTGA